jgi:hypothetical protein
MAIDFGIDYERKRVSGCLFNMVSLLGFASQRQNELAVLFMGNEIDCIVDNYLNEKTPFQSFCFLDHYIAEIPNVNVKVNRLSKKNDGSKFVTVKTFIYYKLVKAADELDSDTFVAFHEILLLDAIIAASKKYKIPEENYHELVERRSKLGTIPEWISEMEDNPQLVIDMYKKSVPK